MNNLLTGIVCVSLYEEMANVARTYICLGGDSGGSCLTRRQMAVGRGIGNWKGVHRVLSSAARKNKARRLSAL